MGRLNLNLEPELHKAFRDCIKVRDDYAQTRIIKKFIRAYIEGKVWFELNEPRLRGTSPSDAAPRSYEDMSRGPVTEPVKPTIKDYRNFVSTWRMNSYTQFGDNPQEDEAMLTWGVNEFKCDRDELRKMIIAYPPDAFSSPALLRKKTAQLIGEE